MSRLVNRNVTGAAGRTSMRLEPEFWDALREMCARQRTTMAALIQLAEREAPADGSRTSAVRAHVLSYFRAAAREAAPPGAAHLAAAHPGAAHPVAGHGAQAAPAAATAMDAAE